MKNRILVLLSCFIMAFCPSMAQTPSEAELENEVISALQLNKQKKYEEAAEALAIISEKTKGMMTPFEREVFIMCQTSLCFSYEMTKRYDEGYTLAKQLLKLELTDKERERVVEQYVLNGYLFGCTFMHRESGNFAKAREMFEEVLPYATDRGDVRNKVMSKIPMSWYFEAANYQRQQKYELAIPCLSNSIKGYHDLSDFPNEIRSWYEIGSCKEHLYDIAGASNAYNEGLKVSKQIGDTSSYMQALRSLCKLNASIGNINEKLRLENQMDSLVNTDCPAEVAYEYYMHKGNESKSLGMLDMAEQWYLKLGNLIPRLRKPKAPQHVYHMSLRDLYLAKKDYDLALKYAEKAKNDFMESYHGDSNQNFLSYATFVEIYKAKGDSTMAKTYIDSVMIAEKYLSEPREISMLYSLRGRFYSYYEDFQNAFNDFDKAEKILAAKYDEMDIDRIKFLPFLGGTQWKLNNNDECEHYFKEYERRVKAVYGEESLEYLNAVNYLANAEGVAGHIEAGCKDYERSVAMLKKMTKEQLPYLNSEERESFWTPFSALLTEMTPFAIEAKLLQGNFTRSCYDALVLSKAFLLESERNLYDILKNGGNEEDLNSLMTIAAIQSQIKELEKDFSLNADEILKLNQKKSRLERELLDACKKNGNMTSFMDVDYLSVKESLAEGDYLIDFTDYVTKSQGRKYAAYIVEKKQKNPVLIPLFAESKIDSLEILRPDMYYEEPYSEKVIDILWKPLAANITEGSTVYYVPSHILFQIALESIPMSDGTLLGDHYNFVRLSSAREVRHINNYVQFANNKSAVLYGGLKYDLSSEEMVSVADKYEISPLLALRGDIVRGDSIYRELKETKKEIDAIDSYLSKHQIDVVPYSGVQGTEESFLNMNGHSPNILHIATHGFYYTPEQAEKVDYLKGYKDAMSLSGLVLSGGNAAWKGKELPDGVLGGILTARNIARMDMTGTELVVLSACQTGQGKATSEGLYGLQRAFKKANAQSMIMTLWSVSDVASREFMEEFYKNLTNSKKKWNKRKAFDEAKKFIRDKYEDAYYWAAFVMLD